MSQQPVYQQTVYSAQNRRVAKHKLHPAMQRIYRAAAISGHIGALQQQSALASLLNVAPQLVNNWDSRGPSAAGLLALQAKTGLNATWAATGTGPMFISSAAAIAVVRTGDEDTPAFTVQEALPAWPFERLDSRKVHRLSRDDILRLEGAIMLIAQQLGLDLANQLAA